MMQGFPGGNPMGMGQQMPTNSVISQPAEPIVINFKTPKEGTNQVQENVMKITLIDQSPDVHQKVQEAYGLIQNSQNSKALEIF